MHYRRTLVLTVLALAALLLANRSKHKNGLDGGKGRYLTVTRGASKGCEGTGAFDSNAAKYRSVTERRFAFAGKLRGSIWRMTGRDPPAT